jgi:8-oxo-dGTP pyrophosphatase MutT (NUDIX family)
MIHPDVEPGNPRALKRRAARGIVVRDDRILLLFTERYNDFSFPGGGVDEHEDLAQGLRRELEEETGAQGINILKNYGFIEEFRPYHKPEFDFMHMISHFFVCEVDPELQQTRMESYEHANGMRPLWVNLHEALAHNQEVMRANDKKMGLSIERETFMLEKVASELESDFFKEPK